MSIDYKVSIVGYKAADNADGYVSRTITNTIRVSEEALKKFEAGAPVPQDVLPKLPKGYVDSPAKITKTEKYDFKPTVSSGSVNLVSSSED